MITSGKEKGGRTFSKGMDHCALDMISNKKFDTKKNMCMLKRVVTLLQKPIYRLKNYNGYEGKNSKVYNSQ